MLQIVLSAHVEDVSLIQLAHFLLDITEKPLGFGFGEGFGGDEPIVNVFVMQMQLQLIKNQWLNILRRPFLLFLYFFLVIIKNFENLGLEFRWLHLHVVVVFENEHVAVAGDEEVDDLLVLPLPTVLLIITISCYFSI